MIVERTYTIKQEGNHPSVSNPFRELPFVGRNEELDIVEARLAETVKGRGGIVFLSGEAGIGKTRLAAEAVNRAEPMGYRCLTAKCRSDVGSPLYHPWMELFRQFSQQASAQLFFKICGVHMKQVVRLVPELFESAHPHPPGSPSSQPELVEGHLHRERPQRAPQKMPEDIQKEGMLFLHALGEIFFRLSQESPVLMIVDDMQWCDTASLKAINFFVANVLPKTRILFLCLFRDLDLKKDPNPEFLEFVKSIQHLEDRKLSSSIRLARFDHENIVRLVQETLQQGDNHCVDDFARLLSSRTGGNPLFISETIRSLLERNVIFRNEKNEWVCPKTVEKFSLPDSIRSVIEGRLERLDPSTLDLLRVASVIGENFNLEILRTLSAVVFEDLTFLESSLDKAAKSGLVLVSTDSARNASFIFSDEWVRDLLYDRIGPNEKQHYHLLVAHAVEDKYTTQNERTGSEHFLALAHHYLKGGDFDKAQTYFTKAARRAADLYAHQEAYARYNTALGLLESSKSPEKLRKDTSLRAELLKNMGDEAQFLPHYEKTLECWKRSAELYEADGERLKAADVLVKLGMAYHLVMYELEESDKVLQRAVELAKEDSDTPSAELARLNAYAMTADIWRSDRQKVKERSALAMKLAEESDAYDVIAMVSSYGIGTDLVGEIDQSIESCNRGLEISEEHGLMWEASYNYFHRACVHNYTYGPSRKSLDLFLEGLDYTRTRGNFMLNLFHRVELVYGVYIPLGEWARAREVAEESLKSVAGFPPNSLFCLIAESAMGHVLLAVGELEMAERYLEHVRQATKGFGVLQLDVPLYIALARLNVEKGDFEKAKEHLVEGYRLSKLRGLSVINGIPHVQLLSAMIEHCLAKRETEGKNAITDAENQSLDAKITELTEATREINKEWTIAYLHRAEGLIAQERKQYEKGLTLLEKSLEVFLKLEWPYETAKARYILAKANLQRANLLSSARFLRAASSVFSKLGARRDLERTLHLLKQIEGCGIPQFDAHPIFQNKQSELVFEALKTKFMNDLLFKKFDLEQCGWKSLNELLRELNLSKYAFYGSSDGMNGPVLKELKSLGVTETRIFSGQRGRGGEIMKIRASFQSVLIPGTFEESRI
ncbi:MAG: ATP-binding protein [Nitrososphaerales archaeon]